MPALSKKQKKSVANLVRSLEGPIVRNVPVGQQVREHFEGLGETECWDWGTGQYVRIRVGSRMIGMSRAILGTHGTKTVGLHSCDNPPCINPAHLSPGTHLDNALDKVRKGRSMAGEKHWAHRLTDRQVQEIRDRFESWGYNKNNGRLLAAEYGVTRDHVRLLVKGKYRASIEQ